MSGWWGFVRGMDWLTPTELKMYEDGRWLIPSEEGGDRQQTNPGRPDAIKRAPRPGGADR